MRRARCIMVQGTMSGAGKSLLLHRPVPHFSGRTGCAAPRSRARIWP